MQNQTRKHIMAVVLGTVMVSSVQIFTSHDGQIVHRPIPVHAQTVAPERPELVIPDEYSGFLRHRHPSDRRVRSGVFASTNDMEDAASIDDMEDRGSVATRDWSVSTASLLSNHEENPEEHENPLVGLVSYDGIPQVSSSGESSRRADSSIHLHGASRIASIAAILDANLLPSAGVVAQNNAGADTNAFGVASQNADADVDAGVDVGIGQINFAMQGAADAVNPAQNAAHLHNIVHIPTPVRGQVRNPLAGDVPGTPVVSATGQIAPETEQTSRSCLDTFCVVS